MERVVEVRIFVGWRTFGVLIATMANASLPICS
jgi:hypothetical protein